MEHTPVEIGDFIPATLIKRVSSSTWLVEPDESLDEWTVQLSTRNDELWESGAHGLFRIYKAMEQRRELWLTTSDRGFLPVSDRMRPRYRKAIRSVIMWMEQGYETSIDDFLLDISEVKGIFNRCLKGDQADWFEVWTGLGKPSHLDMKRVVQLFTEWRLVKDDLSKAVTIANRLRGLGVQNRLHRFLEYLDEKQEPLPSVQKEQKHHPSGSPSGSITRPTQSERTKRALDFAVKEHRDTLETLIVTLKKKGYLPEQNTFIDLFTRLWSGPAIFEIKSISQSRDNELSQVRHGVSQLYEYAYRHGYSGAASLWLVFSSRPSTTWLVPYLTDDRDIHVMWREDGELVGPSAHELVRK